MIRAFNSFQLVTLFAATPFIVEWLDEETFTLARAGFWLAIAVYLVLFVTMIVALFHLTERKD
jgi:hypothetical protein